MWGALFCSLLVPVLFGWWAPHAARLSFARWLLGSSERWPQRTYLTVMGLDAGGRLLAPRDERFLTEVRTDLPEIESRAGRWVVHGRGEPLVLRWKPERPRTPEAVQVQERTADGSTRAGMMVEADPVRFRYEFPASPSSSTFELSGGDDWLEPLRLERVNRPSLAGTRLRVKEPGASDQPPGSLTSRSCHPARDRLPPFCPGREPPSRKTRRPRRRPPVSSTTRRRRTRRRRTAQSKPTRPRKRPMEATMSLPRPPGRRCPRR